MPIATPRYFLACSRYIDQNPVRAGIVRDAADFQWSSHARLAHGHTDPLVCEHEEYEALGPTAAQRQQVYRELCTPPVEPVLAQGIRRLTRRGLALTAEALTEQPYR